MAEQKVKLTDLPSATDTVDTAQLLINQNSTDQKLPVTHFLRAKNNLSDITNAEQARANINAPSVDEVNNKLTSYINGSYTFNAGANISSRKDYIWDEESKSWYYWTGDLPKDVPAASSPESTGGIGKGEWALIGATQPTIKTPFDFGAKGDGVTDDTLALQAYIDGVDGDIDLYGKTYLVSKNPALATTYPTEPDLANNGYNFCPCLALVGKSNVRIFNGKLVVKVHGMDALALINCQNVTVTLEIQGPNKFPAIDAGSGYAEKGDVGFGYGTSAGKVLAGPNNSIDTSTANIGNYNLVSGSFPDYDDNGNVIGTRSNWGKFLGGYIGSWSCGIKIQRASKSIVVNTCKISGFNFAGVGIGIRNIASTDVSDYNVESDVPDGVLVVNCTISKCYTAGIDVLSGYNIGYFNNFIHDIGHPDGDDIANASYDPGYGCTVGRNRRVRNITVDGNYFNNCRRKSIDFHGGGQLIITNNFCLETGIVGIYAKCGSGWRPNYEPFNITIENNYIRTRNIPDSTTNANYPSLAGAKYTRGIDVGGGGEATGETYPYPYLKVLSNYVELKSFDGVGISNSAGPLTTFYIFNDINVSNNTVVLKNDVVDCKATAFGINAGATTKDYYRDQQIKFNFNSVKSFNTMNLNYRANSFQINGVPHTIVAHGNSCDLNASNQSSSMSLFVFDERVNYSFKGNKMINYANRETATGYDIMFFDNTQIRRPANSEAISIPMSMFRGVWEVGIAGSGDYFGARQINFASSGTSGTGVDVVGSQTTGGITSIGVNATAITLGSVTNASTVVITAKPIVQFNSIA